MSKLGKANIEKPHIEKIKIGPVTIDKPRIMRHKKGERPPDFDSLFDPSGIISPLDELDYPEDPTEAAEAEISEVLRAILEEKKRRKDAFRTLVDTEYWFAICFQSRAQKEEFLQKIGWSDLGDKYIDGLEVAHRLGVEVEPIPLKTNIGDVIPKLLRNVDTV